MNRPASVVDRSTLVNASASRVLAAFFEPEALAAWWQAVRSVTTPRALGVFAVEWVPTIERDDLLGRLGGVFHGTVMDYKPGRELFVADAWWMPPDTDPLGPMSLQISCTPQASGCRLRIRQSGFEDSPRWQRYYRIIDSGWRLSMEELKRYVEGPLAADR